MNGLCFAVAILSLLDQASMARNLAALAIAGQVQATAASSSGAAKEARPAASAGSTSPKKSRRGEPDPDSLLDPNDEEVAALDSPDAAPVFQADFEFDSDLNYDRWPDGWSRKHGTGYPPFAKVEIVKTATAPSGKHAFCLSLDGGAIEVSSPCIPLRGEFSYAAEVWLKTEGLVQDAARCTFLVTDDAGRTIVELHSTWHRENNGWIRVNLGPVTPPDTGKLRGFLVIEVEPQVLPGDLHGKVWIDRVQMTRLPRMLLTSNSDHQVFLFPERPKLTCAASGIQQQHPQVEFVLLDALGNTLAKETTDFKTTGQTSSGEAPGFIGSAEWEPPVEDVGFYRVRATMLGTGDRWLTRETTFVVLNPVEMPGRGEYGWSLSRGEEPLPVGPLSQVLLQSGLHYVRFPVWFHQDNQTKADRIAWFAERLSMHHVELIGVLDRPPTEARTTFRDKGELPAASLFADPELWGPIVDPVMTRLSLKVRRWQLGGDRDISFVGYPDLAQKIEETRGSLNRFGQNLKLVLNWNWLHDVPLPDEGAAPWNAITYSADPPLTADELLAYLPRKNDSQGERWVELEPLPAGTYALQDRVRDLIGRMIAAKQGGADVIFASQPFDNERGLMRRDGTPGELFLPWRTAATLLSGCQYVGEFQLPNNSTNVVFARDGKAVMVVWNERPTEESFYSEVGSKVIDVWGRATEIGTPNADGDGKIQVGPWPVFVVGLNEHLARWRITTNFKSRRLESIFGREQKLVLQMKNPFPQAVAGEVTVHADPTWEYPRQPLRFRVPEGENFELAIPVLLSLDANGGAHPVRLDFDLNADEHFDFSLFRTVYVGLEDVTVETQTRQLEDNSLQLELTIQNQTTTPVSFNFTLFPPERRRETKQLVNLPPGRTTARVLLPNADELIGKRIYLRAEELGGPRVFNQSVVVER